MLDLKEIVAKYIARHSREIARITEPLHALLGINYVTFHKIDNKGVYSVLVDSPEWAEHYVDNKFYEVDPFLHHPDHYRCGITSWSCQGTSSYQEKVIGDAVNKFGMHQGVSLMNKVVDEVEIFGFTSSSTSHRLYEIVASNMCLFRAFRQHFKTQLSSILNQIEEEGILLEELKGKSFAKDPRLAHTLTDSQRLMMLQQLGLGDLISKAKKLSTREKQCLLELLRHKTTREIGKSLSLSSRTVEHYFENLKSKWGILTKRELILIGKQLSAFGLIFDSSVCLM